MLLKKLATWFLIPVLALAGCSTSSSGEDSDSTDSASYSQAYLDGYNGNVGASPALISNSGGPTDYCQSVLLLHMYETTAEEDDYINGCLDVIGASSLSTADSAPNYGDLLTRLNSAGGDSWDEDAFDPVNPPEGFLADYLANGTCTLWVFETGDLAASAANDGFLDNFYSYSYSWGTEPSGLGVIAMYEDSSSNCANDMLETLGWDTWP